MSGTVNKAILVGNVGKDPEIRRNQAGDPVATFSVATSEHWRDDHGERHERTSWHRIVVTNKHLVTGVVEKYITKGKKVFVEGAIMTRSYDKDGEKKYITEIVVGPFHSTLQIVERFVGTSAGDEGSYGAKHDDMDQEIPF